MHNTAQQRRAHRRASTSQRCILVMKGEGALHTRARLGRKEWAPRRPRSPRRAATRWPLAGRTGQTPLSDSWADSRGGPARSPADTACTTCTCTRTNTHTSFNHTLCKVLMCPNITLNFLVPSRVLEDSPLNHRRRDSPCKMIINVVASNSSI